METRNAPEKKGEKKIRQLKQLFGCNTLKKNMSCFFFQETNGLIS